MKRFSIPPVLGLLALFAFVLWDAHGWVGQTFPGFLSFENGLSGRFFLPSWKGPAVFSFQDYLGVVVLPAATGLLFAAAGAGLAAFIGRAGRPLFFFHLLVGTYLVLSPDFHLAHRFSHAELLAFVFLPAALLHFALAFPERTEGAVRVAVAPYVASAVLAVPYLLFFKGRPSWWSVVEVVVVAYLAGAYLFWVTRLASMLKRPQREADRLLARFLLRGQWVAFTLPFLAGVAVFAARIPIPLNLAASVILLFPAAVFAGGLMARLYESQMRLVASERMASLGMMMAGLAHELKNPLNFVVANLDALKEKATGSEVQEIVADIEEGAERMRMILEDFRFFAGPERKGRAPVDLNEVVRHAANLLRPRCEGRVSLALLLNEIPKVSGDASALGQAALNLIVNAIESISGEGEVAVTTGKRDGKVFLSVRDTGSGILPENLRRIFDPFFTTKPQRQGTGLGLALTERIIREHGGLIEVKSEVGKGAEFLVTLPSR